MAVSLRHVLTLILLSQSPLLFFSFCSFCFFFCLLVVFSVGYLYCRVVFSTYMLIQRTDVSVDYE